jgi:hypothetical protein
MRIGSLLLGIIDIAIVAGLLLLVGLVIVWFVRMMGQSVPGQLRQMYLVVVLLIALYMIVALLFGLPTTSIMR